MIIFTFRKNKKGVFYRSPKKSLSIENSPVRKGVSRGQLRENVLSEKTSAEDMIIFTFRKNK